MFKLIAGLGNPGLEYQNTHHNVGRLFVEFIAKKLKTPKWEAPAGKSFRYSKSASSILIIPTTFMNQSGIAIVSAKKFFSTPTEKILVVHDDSDLTLGEFKLQLGKSSAGHKGVQSIIDALKTSAKGKSAVRPSPSVLSSGSKDSPSKSPDGKNFWRLRIGIRHQNEVKRAKAENLVLRKITSSDLKKLQSVFKEASTKLIVNDTP